MILYRFLGHVTDQNLLEWCVKNLFLTSSPSDSYGHWSLKTRVEGDEDSHTLLIRGQVDSTLLEGSLVETLSTKPRLSKLIGKLKIVLL